MPSLPLISAFSTRKFFQGIVPRAPVLTLLTAYVMLYGWLLVATDFLPYVMDNNETFSSLWHAANLFNYGVSQSWGLADEAFSPDLQAHPYVHTHQGNFPRLFALLIYVLGARTAESQIVITTFTVGLAAILFIYLFFARIATPWFAFTVGAIFMTDYILFAQWHVVTYRVWHAFFLFSSLLTVHLATESDNRRWWWPITVAFACLFYFELVFAAFVGAFCFLYAVARASGSPRRLVSIVLAQATGASAGLAIVIVQVVGYLGPLDFWRDVYLTFLARNDFSTMANLLDEAGSFYESRRVIFWYNIQDREKFAGMTAFVRSFTSFDWRIHTPLLSLAVWIVCTGWLLGVLLHRGGATISLSRHYTALGYLTLFLGTWLFSQCVFLGEDLTQAPVGIATAGVVTALALAISGEVRRQQAGTTAQQEVLALAVIGIMVGAAGVLVQWHGALFDQTYRPMWQELQGRIGPSSVAALVLIAAAVVGAYLAVAGARRVMGETARVRLQPVIVYLACGAAAYTIVYALSPGYIYSGYLARHAPFTVFLTDVAVAVGLYVAFKTAFHCMRTSFMAEVGTGWRAALLAYAQGSLAAATAGLALFIAVFWIVVQVSYVLWLPPTHYAFLKTLSQPPYRAASFVVNNYAAPVAANTGQWAYMDSGLERAQLVRDGESVRLVGDRRYLWFADRDENSAYRRPQYFLCMVPQSPYTVLLRILQAERRGPGYPGCGVRPLVLLAKHGRLIMPGIELVGSDEVGPHRIGFDAWAIVKLQSAEAGRGFVLDWEARPRSRTGHGATD